MSNLSLYVLFCIISTVFIYGTNFVVTANTGTTFGKTLPLSFVLSALVLYFFGLLNNLYLGYLFLWLFIILMAVFLVVKRKGLEEFKKNYFTTSFFVFFIVLVTCYIFYYKFGFENCDEYMHWGPMVKTMFSTNKFYCYPNDYLVVHRDYPPFFQLIELLFCYLGNDYNESYLYIGLVSFMFSLFMPLFDVGKKDKLKLIPVFIAMILVGLLVGNASGDSDYAYVYNSIYVDWTLFVLIAHIVFYIYKIEKFKTVDYIYFTAMNTALLLCKQIGLVFFLMISFYVFLKIAYLEKGISIKGKLKYYGISFIISLFVSRTWTMLINNLEVSGQFTSNLSIGKFISIIRWTEPEVWRSEVFNDFLYRVLHTDFVLGLSFAELSLVITLLIIVAGWFKKETLFITTLFVIATIGYTVLLGAMYSMQFSIEEALEFASFNRYMGSFLYFGCITVFYLASNSFIENKNAMPFAISAIVMFIFINQSNYNYLIPKRTDKILGDVIIVKQYESGVCYSNNGNYGRKFNYIYADADRIRKNDSDYLKTLLGDEGLIYIECYDNEFYSLWMNEISDNEPYAGYMYSYYNNGNNYELYEQGSNFFYYILKYASMN